MSTEEQEKVLKDLGQVIRRAREVSGMTQQEVADKANVHVNFYARVERGEVNPSYDKLRRMMKVLDVKSADLP